MLLNEDMVDLLKGPIRTINNKGIIFQTKCKCGRNFKKEIKLKNEKRSFCICGRITIFANNNKRPKSIYPTINETKTAVDTLKR